MAVDFLRSCYSQEVTPYADDTTTVRIRWYFCGPEARILPFGTAYGLLTWETDPFKLGPIGQINREQEWDNGRNRGYPGLHWHGDPAWFQEGIPAGTPVDLRCGGAGTARARLGITGALRRVTFTPAFWVGPPTGGGRLPYFNGGGGIGPGGYPATGPSRRWRASVELVTGVLAGESAPLGITASMELVTGVDLGTPAPLAITAAADLIGGPYLYPVASLASDIAVSLHTGPAAYEMIAPLAMAVTVALYPVQTLTLIVHLGLTGSVSFSAPPYTTLDLVAPLAAAGSATVHLGSGITFRGSGTWSVPAGVTSIRIQCLGAGADGGRGDGTGNGGGGGGGGSYAEATLAVTAGDVVTVHIDATDTWASITGIPPVTTADGSWAGAAPPVLAVFGGAGGSPIVFAAFGGFYGRVGGDGAAGGGGGGANDGDPNARGIDGTSATALVPGAGNADLNGTSGDGSDGVSPGGTGTGVGQGGGGAWGFTVPAAGAGSGGQVILTPM